MWIAVDLYIAQESLPLSLDVFSAFLLQTLANHRTAGKEGRHFSNSSLPFSPASQTLSH